MTSMTQMWCVAGVLLCTLATSRAVQAQQAAASLHITSTSFAAGQRMPRNVSCDGPDVSPALQWTSAPAAIQSYAIVMDDPDAPTPFTHWLAYAIPAATHGLPEGASTPSARLMHATEGRNSFGNLGYGGPCPPPGKPHHYVFHVYALDVSPSLPAGEDRQGLLAAMHGHVLAEGAITGLYGHDGP